MALILILFGVGIVCYVAGEVLATINETHNYNIIVGFVGLIGSGVALIIFFILLPLAILIKVVKYFWQIL